MKTQPGKISRRPEGTSAPNSTLETLFFGERGIEVQNERINISNGAPHVLIPQRHTAAITHDRTASS